MIMAMFVQPTEIPDENRQLHLNNIDTANLLAYAFNQNIMEEPSSVVYNATTSRVQQHINFDSRPEFSKVIIQQINCLLDYESNHSDKVDFLVPYLKSICNTYFNDSPKTEEEKEVINTLFLNLNLENYFDNISADFLKKKLNEKLPN